MFPIRCKVMQCLYLIPNDRIILKAYAQFQAYTVMHLQPLTIPALIQPRSGHMRSG